MQSSLKSSSWLTLAPAPARQAVIAQAPGLVAEDEYGSYQRLTPARAQELLRRRVLAFRQQYPARAWQSCTEADEAAFRALPPSAPARPMATTPHPPLSEL